MKKSIKKWVAMGLATLLSVGCLSACGNKKEQVLIYTSAEDYRVEYLNQRLAEKFPDYEVVVEYMSTGNIAAKMQTEGKSTDCDILWSMEYGYMEMLDETGLFASLSDYDSSVYVKDTIKSTNYFPELRNGGAIIVNTDVLAKKGLPKPTSYEDLLKPEYKGLISMPNPKSSGTGYMFLKSLVNEWGEKEALDYFDKLTPNILQYTSSGSGPVNSLIQGEIAIGLGMTSQAVTKINEGAPLEILFFEEGSPYSLYGEAIISGKETNKAVKDVFTFLVGEFNYENVEKFFPEKIYVDKDCKVENYPSNIKYSDMSNDSREEKTRLLELWKY